jgi:hypothetical protein
MPINSQHTKGGGGGGDEGEGGGVGGGGGGGRKGKKEGDGAKGTRKPKVDKNKPMETRDEDEDPGRPEGIIITTFRWVYTNSILFYILYMTHEKQCTTIRLICSRFARR